MGIRLAVHYPHGLYNFTLVSLGKKLAQYVQSDRATITDATPSKILCQQNAEEYLIPNLTGYEITTANTDLLTDINAVSTFDWPYLSQE